MRKEHACVFEYDFCLKGYIKYKNTVDEQLNEIQSRLLDVGSAIATPMRDSSSKKLARVEFRSNRYVFRYMFPAFVFILIPQ